MIHIMPVIPVAEFVSAGEVLLALANQRKIPYANGGMTLAGMDCQGMYEYLLIQCGMSRAEADLPGSNAHWRQSMKWRGTPEECAAVFGRCPEGAVPFIWRWEEGGMPAKYHGDGEGDLYHMGVYLGGERAVHASQSRGQVLESKFAGKTISNGGWNRVGLSKWVRYADGIELKLHELNGGSAYHETEDGTGHGGAGGGFGGDEDYEVSLEEEPAEYEPVKTERPQYRYFAVVDTKGGGPAKMREKPSKTCALWKEVPDGEIVLVIGKAARGGTTWSKVERNSRRWYIMDDYLKRVEG